MHPSVYGISSQRYWPSPICCGSVYCRASAGLDKGRCVCCASQSRSLRWETDHSAYECWRYRNCFEAQHCCRLVIKGRPLPQPCRDQLRDRRNALRHSRHRWLPHTSITGYGSYDRRLRHRVDLRHLLAEHNDLFAWSEMDLGYTDKVHHRIPVTTDVPVSQPYRRLPPKQFEEVRQHLKSLMERGVIRESTSPYSSPIVLVRKSNGDLRMCVDYR